MHKLTENLILFLQESGSNLPVIVNLDNVVVIESDSSQTEDKRNSPAIRFKLIGGGYVKVLWSFDDFVLSYGVPL
jgi:hypothetical protein